MTNYDDEDYTIVKREEERRAIAKTIADEIVERAKALERIVIEKEYDESGVLRRETTRKERIEF